MALAVGGLLQAQPRGIFNIGGGFTEPIGGTGSRLDRGWNVNAGAGVAFNRFAALKLDFTFNRASINQSTLASLGFPDGNVRMWGLTLNPEFHTNADGFTDIYFTVGGGLYRRTQEFTQPTVATVVGYDPFFGLYQAAVPATQVLSSYSVLKPGVNGGIGIAFGRRRAKIYAEARYHRMFIGDSHTDMLPVTFGVRF
jgi:hypothetical protein